MKHLLLLALLTVSVFASAQSFEDVTMWGDKTMELTHGYDFESSAINSVIVYDYLVTEVVFIQFHSSNQYYMFTCVPFYDVTYFTDAIESGDSVGQAYHEYIKPNTCN